MGLPIFSGLLGGRAILARLLPHTLGEIASDSLITLVGYRPRAFPVPALIAFLSLSAFEAIAQPNRISGLGRSQHLSRSMADADVLRIWMLYVGQGDAVLIQLPNRFVDDGEEIEVLVDGGKSGAKLRQYMRQLYDDPISIEHVILTHHDLDHMQGLTGLLKDPRFRIRSVYHNGLASWLASRRPANATPHVSDGARFMGVLNNQNAFRRQDLVNSMTSFANPSSKFHGTFERFADALGARAQPQAVDSARRVHKGLDFDPLAASTGDEIELQFLWPPPLPRGFNSTSWSHTVNGNSVTFRLDYGDFSILFTGDHNDFSGPAILDAFEGTNQEDVLDVDVLKVPHHGSGHADQDFLRATDPAISIASMGSQGFTQWNHPDEDVIAWVGGMRRIFHTHIHERRLRGRPRNNSFVEGTHIVVETDGEWFRVVELEDLKDGLPTVRQTSAGDGTRWIRARD